MLCAVAFFVGVAVGLLAAAWSDLFTQPENPQAKSRIIQHGASQLREHSELESISPRPNPAAEFEPMQEFREVAGEYKPALDVLARKKAKPSQQVKRG